MNSLRNKCSGITLIEVVVGIAIMGTLLSLMLVAAGRLEVRRDFAERKLESVQIANGLMSEFFALGFPRLDSRGEIVGHPGWFWTLSGRPLNSDQGLLSTVRVSVYGGSQTESEPKPLSTIEVLVTTESIGRGLP